MVGLEGCFSYVNNPDIGPRNRVSQIFANGQTFSFWKPKQTGGSLNTKNPISEVA
jgi:hypothetical protein